MTDQIEVFTEQGAPWRTDRGTWAGDTGTWADGSGYLDFGGVPGPTHFVRLGGINLTPRAAGDLIVNPNIAAIEWNTGWIYPSLTNNWVPYGGSFGAPRYRMLPGRMVVMDGLMASGFLASVAFVLPAGFRPKWRLITCAMHSNNNLPARLDVDVDGRVIPVGGTRDYFTLAVTFFAG